MQKKIRKKIKELAKKHNIPESIVEKVYESQFRMTREYSLLISLEDVELDELDNIKTNFNYKYLGKLGINKTLLKRKREKNEK